MSCIVKIVKIAPSASIVYQFLVFLFCYLCIFLYSRICILFINTWWDGKHSDAILIYDLGYNTELLADKKSLYKGWRYICIILNLVLRIAPGGRSGTGANGKVMSLRGLGWRVAPALFSLCKNLPGSLKVGESFCGEDNCKDIREEKSSSNLKYISWLAPGCPEELMVALCYQKRASYTCTCFSYTSVHTPKCFLYTSAREQCERITNSMQWIHTWP